MRTERCTLHETGLKTGLIYVLLIKHFPFFSRSQKRLEDNDENWGRSKFDFKPDLTSVDTDVLQLHNNNNNGNNISSNSRIKVDPNLMPNQIWLLFLLLLKLLLLLLLQTHSLLSIIFSRCK